MKWISVNNPLASIKRYHLVKGNGVEMVLKYNILQHSGRVIRAGEQRVFFIEQTGFWGNKIVFENEYGVEVGKLLIDKAHSSEGSIEMNNNRYQYSMPGSQHKSIEISDSNTVPAHFSCDLQLDENPVSSSGHKTEEYACLLLGLCWYLFPPATEEAKKTAEQFSMV